MSHWRSGASAVVWVIISIGFRSKGENFFRSSGWRIKI
uniref:Uncharacterized protein n=1 Tax=Rhizophora mucronata TaxID=61149 RepID=A0A2P2IJ18_RHIMU